MNIDLTDTTSSDINAELVSARRSLGSPATGMVLTLVIVTDEGNHYDALKAARGASMEHPSRILVVVRRPGRSPRDRAQHRLDAEVRMGGGAGSGETVLLRLHGELAAHSYSVVLPLLLPDAPVVVWWPDDAPDHPSRDKLGTLAQRRITDAAAAADPVTALARRAETYAPGDTDLAWTRVTPWRSMLASALDQRACRVAGAVVEGEGYNPSTELLALWLTGRLRVPVERTVTEGPGITAVRLLTDDGEVRLDRAGGTLAELAIPGAPDRHVALHRRTTAELLAEELRRLDPDRAYERAVRLGVGRLGDPRHETPSKVSAAPSPVGPPGPGSAPQRAAGPEEPTEPAGSAEPAGSGGSEDSANAPGTADTGGGTSGRRRNRRRERGT
ncbi:glucose-6-phosphate dehydrogenase assembly protein OpcA [Streptomyces sp. AJS327]|uniref:glucose-6-phosphate dehydrogenase assembly protein OpcA n=1 Tax=Streptomyces sp. AJS327 TaxID=2545265 RepID=UPI0015DE5DDC|nr:glucose-6-phosphate dehydrogenase assembly protein OpcA [Streptomyces sp. AJS327]MBA0050444.1 glucose-6-phosphate dehydrogenase assembly protein OpcA [Streptomyces sp. AJS327]